MTRINLFISILSFTFALVFGLNYGAGAADEEIVVGAMLGIGGPPPIAAGSKQLNLGLKDCFSIANEEGGINGKKIKYVMRDDQYKADVGVEVLKVLVSEHKPLCIFGSGTPVSIAVAPLIRDRYKTLYTSSSFSGKLAQFGLFPSMFVSGPTYGDQVAIALKYIAKSKNRARVALFYTDTSMGKDPIPYGRIICRDFRLKLVGEAKGNIRGGDHSKQILELKRLNPDFVVMHGWVGAPTADVIKQLRDLGINSEIIVTMWSSQKSVLDKLGPDGPTFLGVSPFAYWWMDDVPMIRKLKDYTARHYTEEVQHRPLDYVVAFTSGLVFVECLRRADKAGQLNAEGLVEALNSLKAFDTGGLTPPLTIKNNRFPISRIVKANPAKGVFEPAPLPEGLDKWIKMGY